MNEQQEQEVNKVFFTTRDLLSTKC